LYIYIHTYIIYIRIHVGNSGISCDSEQLHTLNSACTNVCSYIYIHIYICLLYTHIMCNGYIFCDFVQVHTLNSAYTYVCSYICSRTHLDNGCIYVHIHTWTMAASPATPTRYIHSTLSCHSFECVMSHLCVRLTTIPTNHVALAFVIFPNTSRHTRQHSLSPPPLLSLSPATPNRFSPWESKAMNPENPSRILLP